MRFYKFTIVITPDKKEPDRYNVSVPAFPEIATFGDSVEEARFMAQDALELVVLSRLEEGEKIPLDKKPKSTPSNAIVEETVVAVQHQVTATPVDYVKAAIFKGAPSA